MRIPMLLAEGAKAPVQGTEHAAGYDLHAYIKKPIELRSGERQLIPTGLKLSLPLGYCAMVCSRSGLAAKNGIMVLNAPGIIDADYTGDIGVILHNASDWMFTINPGDRIAQLVITPVYTPGFVQVDKLEETARGDGGFGSTGVSAQGEAKSSA